MRLLYYLLLCIGLLAGKDSICSQHQDPSMAEMLYGKDPLNTDPNTCINHIIASMHPKIPAIKNRLEEIRNKVANPELAANAKQTIKEIAQEVRKAKYLPRIMQHYKSFCIDDALEKEYRKLISDEHQISCDEALGTLKTINNTVDEVIHHRRFKIFTPGRKQELCDRLSAQIFSRAAHYVGAELLVKVGMARVPQLPETFLLENVKELLDWYDLDTAVGSFITLCLCEENSTKAIVEVDERSHDRKRSLQEIIKDMPMEVYGMLSQEHKMQIMAMTRQRHRCNTLKEYDEFVEGLSRVADIMRKQAGEKDAVHSPSSTAGTPVSHMKTIVQNAQRVVLLATLVGFAYWLYLKCTGADEQEQDRRAQHN